MSQPSSAIPKGPEDADTCRICRGDDGPLFHPCRCSGSIMYVHQDCLMEWLSHSQKKHCELCKTPFRFTKLYDPHMPDRLPLAIFLKRASLHAIDSLLTWLRGIVVACTWLVWLPWSMRFVWWGHLWIADGGWSGDSLPLPDGLQSPLNTTANPALGSGILGLMNSLSNPAPGHSPLGPIGSLFRGYVAAQNRSISHLDLQRNNISAHGQLLRRDTMLSNVSFIANLTSSASLNSFTIDVLEGQIIMFSILTAVVLVFLIREWVVQQQPVMNMAALNDEAVQANVMEHLDHTDHEAPRHDAHDPENVNEDDDIALEDSASNQESAPVDRQDDVRRPPMPSRNDSLVPNDVMRSLAQPDGDVVHQSAGNEYHPGASGLHDIPASSNEEHANRVEHASSTQHHHSRSEPRQDSSDDYSVIDADSANSSIPTNVDSQIADRVHDNDAAAPTADDESASPQSSPTGSTAAPDRPKTFVDRMCDWLWGDEVPHIAVEPQEQMHIVQDMAAEEPFVPVGDPAENGVADAAQQDDDAAQAFAQAGVNVNDAEAAEELEDLEGLLELIGMQGNILGLFQNAMFMAVVGAAAITTGVWFPYLWGKVMLLFVAHPLQVLIQLPLQLISTMANLMVDLCIWFVGSLVIWLGSVIKPFLVLGALFAPQIMRLSPNFVADSLSDYTKQSAFRILRVLAGRPDNSMSDYMHLSASAHASLRKLQAGFQLVSNVLVQVITKIYNTSGSLDSNQSIFREVFSAVSQLAQLAWAFILKQIFKLPQFAANLSWVNAFNVQINTAGSLTPLDPSLAIWNGTDRLLAVLAGYVFFAVVGTVYVTHLAPFATTAQAKKIEDAIVDVLQQAGGIMKVIVIISIEMLLFPLYCGALLDIATLPLFGQTTFHERVMSTIGSPWTSAFLHWFAGTCYMFHFALFVSMCRKIFRPGVLYFIRDPDDPTFHPVRDVLERNLISQLRKIAFSALIYGGLVIFCMGSVVWAMAFVDTGILPVRWSSSWNVSGFPLDLLLYTSLRPVIVKLWSPSNGVHALYKWWFEKCAAQLKLRHFLLDVDGELDCNDTQSTGRFVRVPGSDQARIPRGHPVFLEVTPENERLDEKPDTEQGVHGKKNANFKMVYVPSHFRLRIIAFIVCLWLLSAMIGLALTLAPLALGRSAFRMILGADTHANDAYAFAIGLIPLALAIYSDTWIREVSKRLKQLFPNAAAWTILKERAVEWSVRAAKVAFTYIALGVIVPCLLSLLVDLYFIGPLFAYVAGGRELRVIHMWQGWTLGIQYVRVAIHVIQRYPESRLARAMRTVVAGGWHNPNFRLALRGFILPLCSISTVVAIAPLPLGYIASLAMYSAIDAERRAQVVRLAYPTVFAVGAAVWIGFATMRAVGRWRLRIQDEVYLIGERLHNFGEKQPPSFSKHTTTRITQT